MADLELEEDLRLQRRMWFVERGGWLGTVCVLAIACSGLLGHGPLSTETLAAPGLRLEHQRYQRHETDARLVLRLPSGAAGRVQVWLDNRYLERVAIERILPEPVQHAAAGERTVFTFARERPGLPLTLTFQLRPDTYGWLDGKLGLPGGPELAWHELVYP